MAHQPEQELTITEIYASIQGESSYAGVPCTFVRLTGCPLRCRWCDTAYAFHGGKVWTIGDVVAEVRRLGLPLVELTGGEPLAQKGATDLVRMLVAAGFKVLIETSGAEDIRALPTEAHIIMDLKCPGSGMDDRTCWSNLAALKATDEIKFVLANRDDYEWARAITATHGLADRFHVLYSCAWGLLAPKDLAAWLVADRVKGRMQLQQHKYIWSPRAKGV